MESGSSTTPPVVSMLKKKINIAPEVKKQTPVKQVETTMASQFSYNPEYSEVWGEDPTLPLAKPSLKYGSLNTLNGYVEDYHVDTTTFEHHFNNFNNKGTALDPDNGVVIYAHNYAKQAANKPTEKRKRKAFGDASDVSGSTFKGPWAPYADEEEFIKPAPSKSKEGEENEEEEEKEGEVEKETKKTKLGKELVQAKSIFHGTTLRDYLGRTFVDHPTHLKPYSSTQCWLPKKEIHVWSGHTKGINAIRFFPGYGHLILSGSMDTTVKIWDVYTNMKCVRTYMGHSKAVRDVCFSNDGRRFLSCSYDKFINLWDTETGDCLGSYTNGKIPYCVKIHPDHDKQNIFLAGCSDKKIVQWDINSGRIVQEYDQHLGAVNTITFIDDNRRFVTSSDDKSLRVWEWGIPVVIKYISEPHMHSMPSVCVHPNGKWFLAQSLDNQILVYSTKDRFRLNKKKRFVGHTVAGYACQVSVSPDGHYVTSGDSEGKLWIWDWKTCRLLKTLNCHQGVCLGNIWHPVESSRVATCGWDSNIKFWD